MRKLRTVLSILFPIAVIVFAVLFFARQWDTISLYIADLQWNHVVVSALVMILGMLVLPIGSIMCLHYMGQNISFVDAYQSYILSQVAKYLPGSIWALPGRIFLYQRQGIPVAVGVNALVAELSLMICSASLLSVLLLGALMPDLRLIMLLIGVGIVTVLVILIAFRQTLLPVVFSRFPRLLSRIQQVGWALNLQQTLILLVFYSVIWLILGVSIAQLVIATGAASADPLYLTGLFAAAWTIGFLVIIAPGGIGVRDTILAAGIVLIVHEPFPAIVAVLSRLTWMIGEFTGLGLCYIMKWSVRKRYRPEGGLLDK